MGLNTLVPIKVFLDPFSFMGGGVIPSDIDGEKRIPFSSHLHQKCEWNFRKLFLITLKNYISPLQGGYHL